MKGFHHLKITLAKEISEKGIEEEEVSNHISVNDIEQSLKNILANKVTEITQTVSMMDAKQLSEILNKLNMARTVQFFAVGNTIPVAIDGAFKLNQIGIPAVSGTIWELSLIHIYLEAAVQELQMQAQISAGRVQDNTSIVVLSYRPNV